MTLSSAQSTPHNHSNLSVTNEGTSNNSTNELSENDIDFTNARVLNRLLEDAKTPWQIFNCKITERHVTKDALLPFLYHYDSMAEDVKSQHPLTPQLLQHFKTPMIAEDAAKLIGVANTAIQSPWQVKITGTLVLSCEPLQIALRLKFTNTAKEAEPIYTKQKKDAVALAMKQWHFYGDIFVVNKHQQPLVVISENDSNWIALPTAQNYQLLPAAYTLAILATLEECKENLPIINDAIIQRLT